MGAQRRGLLFTVSGPSGAGKSTLLHRLCADDPLVRFSVSMTTRAPRPGERDGVDYLFVSEEQFRQAVEQGRLLEWAQVHDHCYGTPAGPVEDLQTQGFDVVLDIDVQGACQVRDRRPDSIFIFVHPPSWQVLEERLRARGTESAADLALRIVNARREMRDAVHFDYLVVNDELTAACDRFRAVFVAERCRRRPETEAAFRHRFGL